VKILFVNPPIPKKIRMLDFVDDEVKKSFGRRVMVGPPLALNELAGMLPDEEIIILDQKTEADNFQDYDFIERYEEMLNSFRPDFVGITCIAAQYNSVVKIIKHTKKLAPKTIVNVGGLYATACPESFVGLGVDVISLGMGKYSLKHMIDMLKISPDIERLKKIPGLAFDVNGRIERTMSICSLSYKEIKENYLCDDVMPNRELTDHYPYIIKQMNKRIHYISTSQGCNYKCNFCSIWQMTDGKYFTKDVEAIIMELKTMEKYPIIRFCDANTFGSAEESRELFKRIIDEGLNNHFYMADVRTDFVVKHPDIMELAVKAGLKVCICGLEATSDDELAAYEKGSNVNSIVKGLRILNELGIYVNGNYIVKPEYDKSDFESLAEFVYENHIYHSGFTVLTPFPGTQLYEEMKPDITINDLDFYNLTNAVVKTKLPEQEFYENIGKLYNESKKSTEKYFNEFKSNKDLLVN